MNALAERNDGFDAFQIACSRGRPTLALSRLNAGQLIDASEHRLENRNCEPGQ